MQKDEILPRELPRHASELKAAVEAVCQSQPFRTSVKSCQFLRHIVRLTLEGNVDELKERLIGIALLGREASYDTGSDAGVRVRANDVRKRLAAYYAAGCSDEKLTFEIPSGSYIPRFYMPRSLQTEAAHSTPATVDSPGSILAQIPVSQSAVDSRRIPLARPPVRELSVQLLALPTLAALFLCVICLRWQLAQEHPFVTFWNTVFQEHQALLYVPVSRPDEQQDVVPADRLEDAAPLFNLAGRFHGRITLTRTLASPDGAGDILILIGAIPASADHSSPSAEGERLTLGGSPAGRRVIDRAAGNTALDKFGRAALLTIDNGPERSIHIDGTDDGAIASLIRVLSEANDFPEGLINSFQDGTVTQIVFPMNPGAQAVVFRELLPAAHTAMNGPL